MGSFPQGRIARAVAPPGIFIEVDMQVSYSALCVAVAMVSSAATAGFSLSHSRTSVSELHDKIDLFITNTGGATGVDTLALDLGGYSIPAVSGTTATSKWSVTGGNPNVFGSFNSTTNSGLTLTNPHNPAFNFQVFKTPNTWTANMVDWGLVWAPLAPRPLNNGSNFQFASLIVTKDSGMHFDLRTGGSIGAAVGLSYDVPPVTGNSGPDITGTGNTDAGTEGGNSFLIGVGGGTGGSGAASSNIQLSLVGDLQGALNAGATITPTAGGLRVDFDAPGQEGKIYNLSFRATDLSTGLSSVETLSLRVVAGVVPEPTSLAALAGLTLVIRRRR